QRSALCGLVPLALAGLELTKVNLWPGHQSSSAGIPVIPASAQSAAADHVIAQPRQHSLLHSQVSMPFPSTTTICHRRITNPLLNSNSSLFFTPPPPPGKPPPPKTNPPPRSSPLAPLPQPPLYISKPPLDSSFKLTQTQPKIHPSNTATIASSIFAPFRN